MDQKIALTATPILLLAGYGSRIAGLTDLPKCLLKINGRTLLEHHFDTWIKCGLKEVIVVLGYEYEKIEQVLQKYDDRLVIKRTYNHDYRSKGNTFSLLMGLEALNGACLIFDGDLLYDETILQNFLNADCDNGFIVGEAQLSDIECAKVLVDQDQYVRMTVDKRAVSEEELKRYRFLGEAIGIIKFSSQYSQELLKEAREFLSSPEHILLNWEHLMNRFLVKFDVGYHFITDKRWIEIDTPEDFARAQEIFK